MAPVSSCPQLNGIVESPRGTGYLLLAMLGGAIVMSLFFEQRAFCSHLRFLGGLSGNYSMTAPIACRANLENCKKVWRTAPGVSSETLAK